MKNSNVGLPFMFSSGYVITDDQIRHLEGRLLTLVESIGLKDTQEKAVKDLVRNEVWLLLSPCFIVSAEDHSLLREKYEKEGRGQVTPRPTSR